MCILSCYNQKKFYALFFGAQMSIGGALPLSARVYARAPYFVLHGATRFGKNL